MGEWPPPNLHQQQQQPNLDGSQFTQFPELKKLRKVRRESITGRRIFEFESYRDGQLFRFNVPQNTRTATWNFFVNATGGCKPGIVSAYLRPGGYPVINADGGSFPENMKVFGDMETHNLTFDPLAGRSHLTLESPVPGDWFMLGHTSPRTKERDFVQRVSRAGVKVLEWDTP